MNPTRLILLAVATSALAADPSPTFTDAASAGPDFAVQGEYTGEGCAAQVIALGDGKFRVVGWTPGLPGAGGEAEKKLELDAQRDGARVVFSSAEWKGEIADGAINGTNRDGKTFALRRIERQSPTLGAKPPAGAVVLFDGKSADQWKGGKMTPEGWLQCGVKSVREFGSGTLHVEFRTPFMPAARGQARGNSGVYLQDRFECQVLDSFGLAGENNEAGGIYTISKPKLNMCFPPLSWQTYDIEFDVAQFGADGAKTKDAVMSVKLNGVLVQDRVSVGTATRAAGRKEGPELGPIQLQHHGNPVVYRNLWFVPKN
ncbi:MAG: DUF1080 domain-containing protein [Chthoniobacteraceae bacterium]